MIGRIITNQSQLREEKSTLLQFINQQNNFSVDTGFKWTAMLAKKLKKYFWQTTIFLIPLLLICRGKMKTSNLQKIYNKEWRNSSWFPKNVKPCANYLSVVGFLFIAKIPITIYDNESSFNNIRKIKFCYMKNVHYHYYSDRFSKGRIFLQKLNNAISQLQIKKIQLVNITNNYYHS